ncbi:N-acetyltransferase [Clostridium sartagoforme]|uniref:N-acetyltransferase n=1 Tax=Clostridium sartagoforme TaxID=84031 RepID=A0A4S2DRA2_9CLOT|nr:GNAT family N-acetyltransferase [Clostridium sartagoforme]TGY43713.1 N-acetyltransferase [Clostridium sartagoforme]
MKEDIIYKVKDQLAKDYNCSIEDFNNKDNLITDIAEVKGSRKYTDDKEIIKILIFNGKLVISADKSIKEWCKENLLNIPGEWMFLYSVLRKIDKKINEFGYEIDNTHHYYLPKENNELVNENYKLKWFEEDEILQFKGDNRFDEAFAFNKNYPDVLAVAAVDDNDNILGMAGASKDSDIMWQIGINVMKEANGKGIASTIVRAVKNEILKRDKVPFYGTVESHIISQKVALKSGFYPVFAEIKFKKIKISKEDK